MQYTIRTQQTASVGDGNYDAYPFDTLVADMRFELSHFTLQTDVHDKQNVRFDVYRQENEVAWKKDCDALPQFGVDYEGLTINYLEEAKPFKSGGQTIKEHYYPGATYSIRLPRNPIQPSLQFFIPNILLSVFILASNNIENAYADMLGTVSLSLLTLVSMYQQIRDNLPDTLAITYIERITMLYIVYSLVPVIDLSLFPKGGKLVGKSGMVLWFIINFVVVVHFATLFVRQYHKSLDRPPPEQKKVAGDKRAADLMWSTPMGSGKQ